MMFCALGVVACSGRQTMTDVLALPLRNTILAHIVSPAHDSV